MNVPDISSLIKGVIAIVGIAIAVGQYSNLEHWSRSQAAQALVWKEPLPYFFDPPNRRVEKRLRKPKQGSERSRFRPAGQFIAR
jgi:hypothetical protein